MGSGDECDFRVKASFFTHPKTRKLQRQHGDKGLVSLMKLWAYARVHRSRGILHDMDGEDIAIVCDWSDGGDQELVNTLLELGFLEVEGGEYALHGWREHNHWSYMADERSESARKAAETRWKGKSRGKSSR